MQMDQIAIGRSYAFREKPRRTASPVFRVKVLDIVKDKRQARIRYEDGPHPGLEEYVATSHLLAAWGERHAILRDQEKKARLLEHARKIKDEALIEAASAVLESTGERGASVSDLDTRLWESQLQRILDRAGVPIAPTKLHPLAYRDRDGTIHLPLDAAVTVARAFAAAEPRTVVEYLDRLEEELRIKGNQPGERWYHDDLRQMRPGFALARRWAGLEKTEEALREQVAWLRGLVGVAIHELEVAGRERVADRLLRALEGH